MKLLAIALVGALCSPLLFRTSEAAPISTSADVANYSIDAAHSAAIYRIKHMGVSYHYGRFNDISGSIAYDDKKPEASTISLEIKADSLDSGNSKRDADLKGPDWFNVSEFPTLTFKSKSVKKGAAGKLSVTGDLTIHGKTNSVTVDVDVVGAADTKMMGKRAGFETTFSIKREDYGMKNMLSETGIGNEVRITISVEGAQEKAK